VSFSCWVLDARRKVPPIFPLRVISRGSVTASLSKMGAFTMKMWKIRGSVGGS
jgi:hypothetical protein